MAILFPKKNKMATTVERLGIVETKVENLNEKMDDLKINVNDMNADIKHQLKEMYEASCAQHANLSKDLSSFKSQRDKLIWTFAGIVGAGGFFAGHADKILKIFT
jgi:chromosome segregation ATPase